MKSTLVCCKVLVSSLLALFQVGSTLAAETHTADQGAAATQAVSASEPPEDHSGSIFNWTVKGEKLRDVLVSEGLPATQVDAAFKLFDRFGKTVTNRNFMTFVDSSATLSQDGFKLVNLSTGEIESMPNSHGIGSDVDGHAVNFADATDRPGSNKTSLGVYITSGREFQGSFGPSLRIRGYSPTNHNAIARGILVHGYDDVGPGYDRQTCLKHQSEKGLHHPEWCTAYGRLDQGCFALPQSKARDVIAKIQGGSLLYAYSE